MCTAYLFELAHFGKCKEKPGCPTNVLDLKTMKMVRILAVLALIGLWSCKETPNKVKWENVKAEFEMSKKEYPEGLVKVLNAHGGLPNWKNKRTLEFEISKPGAREIHTIDLCSRRDKIEMPEASIGFDGKKIWLFDPKGTYKGTPAVYHNLMFYFYAMPFVLADEGIIYSQAKDLTIGAKNYPGIHIGFNAGIGASPKDDYYLYYDPETYQMTWLGYTFTFGSDEKSDSVNWIHYNDWMNVNGIRLPRSITWHVYEDGMIKELKNTVSFENVELYETGRPYSFYTKPENTKKVHIKE